MCWCNPNIRSPVCGKPWCRSPAPTKITEVGPTFIELRNELRSLESDVRMRIQLLETKYAVLVEDLNVYRDDNGAVESVRADVRL